MGYFDHLLPTLGIMDAVTGQLAKQNASFFALENAYWRVIALDTAYNTYNAFGIDTDKNFMPQNHVDWLIKNIRLSNPEDKRPIVFMSHHQYYSAWETGYDSTPSQLAKLLPLNRVPLWIWGHEHRLSFYNKTSSAKLNLTCYARCIGVGGFPTNITKIPRDPITTRLIAYDNRLYMMENGTFRIPIGYNGYTHMTFVGKSLQLNYYSLQVNTTTGISSNTNSTWLVSESFTSDSEGNVIEESFKIIDPDMTVVS